MKTKLFNIKPQATVILSYLLLALFFVGCSEDECQSTPINANEETEIFIERLESIITDIKSLRDESTYGEKKGDYPETSKELLDNEITRLEEVLTKMKENSKKLTASEMDRIIIESNEVKSNFKSTIRLEDYVPAPAELYVQGREGGYIDFGVHPEFSRFGNDGQQKFTVEFWLKLDYIDQTTYILSTFIENYANGIRKGWGLNKWNGRFRMTYGTKDLDLFEPGYSFDGNYDKWVHVAIVTDETPGALTTKMYLNGNEVASQQSDKPDRYYISNDNGIPMVAFTQLTPEGVTKTNEAANGSMKHIHIWSTAKTGEEIQKLYSGETEVTGEEPDLICGWTLNSIPKDNNNIKDLTGKYTAKLIGAYQWNEIPN